MRRNTVAIQRLYVRVGQAIYQLRHAECLTRKELASRVNVTETHLHRVEEGSTACSLHLLAALADEFDVTLDDLVPVSIDEKELCA